MKTIITELYEAFKPDLISPEELKVLKQESEIIEKIEKQLSVDDFEDLWVALARVNGIQAEESFARGFRLGARLMLEVTAAAGS